MLDEKWLDSIRGVTISGDEIDGLLGVGAEKVVFKVKQSDGKEFAMATSRFNLGYHLKEIPLFLSTSAQYDINVLNNKLMGLVGNSILHRWTHFLNSLHVRFLKIIQKHGVPGSVFSCMTAESVEYMPFFLNSPGMKERLTELATWPEPDPAEFLSMFITIYGEFGDRPFEDMVTPAQKWASEALEAIERLPFSQDINPDSLYENPLIVWGAAIMSGFFTDDELDVAVSFVEDNFGRIPKRDDVYTLISQFGAITSMFAQYGSGNDNSSLQRWNKFAAKCGLITTIRDRSGNIVA